MHTFSRVYFLSPHTENILHDWCWNMISLFGLYKIHLSYMFISNFSECWLCTCSIDEEGETNILYQVKRTGRHCSLSSCELWVPQYNLCVCSRVILRCFWNLRNYLRSEISALSFFLSALWNQRGFAILSKTVVKENTEILSHSS